MRARTCANVSSTSASEDLVRSTARLADANATSGSFPSAHMIAASTAALTYAVMIPEAYQDLMLSAQQFGLSRNIIGVHYPTDIIGGRIVAYYAMAQALANNPSFVTVAPREGARSGPGSAFLAAPVFLAWFRNLLIRRIGGSTGDCLGFAAYVGQILLLLAATAW